MGLGHCGGRGGGGGGCVSEVYVRQAEALVGDGVDNGPRWLAELRRGALEEFRRTGFPSTKDEEWRFTPIAPIARSDFRTPIPARETAAIGVSNLEPFLFGHPEWPRLVFVDGVFASRLSDLGSRAGISMKRLAAAMLDEPGLLERHLGRHATPGATPFTALNTALAVEGAVIRVARGTVQDDPIHLLFVATAAADAVAIQPRTLVVVEPEARVQLVESYVTLAADTRYWTNAVTEVAVGEGAWVEHSRIQREAESAYHIGFTQITQEQGSHYRSFSMAMGGAIARHNLHTRLGGENAEALLYGLYIAHGDQLIDNHTTIYHDQPNCRSWEVYKGLLDQQSHGVFNGKILVKPEAQKTDAKQTNRALLLSRDARIDTKPQLEIFADDVKCTHGATVGQLDQMAVFYLQSRGVPKASARQLLTYAFAAEVLDEVASPPVRAALNRIVHERLSAPPPEA